MSNVNLENALKQYGLELPEAPAKGGVYEPMRGFGDNLYYLSGCGPIINGEKMFEGKVGAEITLEQGQQAARYCVLNLLAVMKRELGDLSRVKRIAKSLVLVASTNDFYDQPMVANGATQLLEDVFGVEVGRSARSAIGVNVLPGNIPVEIELLIEVEK